jgi:hypothetical protein
MKQVTKAFENIFHVLYLFLILADIANIEQASLCVRYVLNDQINENFLKFIPSHDRSGFGLANLIIKTVQDLGRNDFFQNKSY